MSDVGASDPIIANYIRDLQHLKGQEVSHELGLKGPFQTLLDKASKRKGWTLVPELSTYSGGKRVVPDGTVRDEYRLARGWWEAKDTGDKLGREIQKKLKAGYPANNTIFEDTKVAVLYQDRSEAGEFALSEPVKVAELLHRFFSHDQTDYKEFERAMEEFKSRIPDLAQSLGEHIAEAHKKNKRFKEAFAAFVKLCRAALNPELTEAKVDEMLIQHLLTERLMRNLFQNPEFTTRNVIAAQVEGVIAALASSSFSRAEFLTKLDPYYNAIERAGANLGHFTEKQDFLNSVYEQFFQRFSPDIADTHGIIYTPREIVDYMSSAVIRALEENFGYTVGSPEVVILDPCTGTGNFVVNLIEKIPGNALDEAYRERLFANEVMLLPYYVASLNIEHAYYERMKRYESFSGMCFADTLDMAEAAQFEMFTPANTERVEREKNAAITIIIGNPPYNVGQKKENDNNKNRKYAVLDKAVSATYSKASRASSKSKLSGEAYVRFFRWATDRLGKRDGIVCFVTNNNFVDDYAFDGMRAHLEKDFELIDHLDLHGDRRQNPKISGTTHNVFGIQLGVGITLAIRKRGVTPRIRYHRVPEMWRRSQKLEFITAGKIPWTTIAPDARHTWLVPKGGEEYATLLPMTDVFSLYTMGLNTNRDDIVYDFNRDVLAERVRKFIVDYNTEVDHHKHDKEAPFSDAIQWSSRLKECLERGVYATFEDAKIRPSLYRPFTKKWVFLDAVINQRTGKWGKIDGLVIAVPGPGNRKAFGALMSDTILPLDLGFEKSQCFPLSHLKDEAVERFRKTYANSKITREDVFHYVYAVFHHPTYYERFGGSLKMELPRVPFLDAFKPLVKAGRDLAALHVNYEQLKPWKLKRRETPDVPYSERVLKLRLDRDAGEIAINGALTLSGIPPTALEYRIGSRSALEWLIDQYRVRGASDPNREDDPEYVVRLIGQVVRVSIETQEIIKALPPFEYLDK